MTLLPRELSREAVLERIGLEVRRSVRATVLSSIGLVLLGAVTGAAVALLFAQRPGSELRHDLRARMPKRLFRHKTPNGETV